MRKRKAKGSHILPKVREVSKTRFKTSFAMEDPKPLLSLMSTSKVSSSVDSSCPFYLAFILLSATATFSAAHPWSRLSWLSTVPSFWAVPNGIPAVFHIALLCPSQTTWKSGCSPSKPCAYLYLSSAVVSAQKVLPLGLPGNILLPFRSSSDATSSTNPSLTLLSEARFPSLSPYTVYHGPLF